MFDWQHFFDQYGVPYVTSGPNVARGDVNIRCPFCGPADPSHHMGVSTDGRGWSCWRDRSHRGKSAQTLVQELLRCSKERARHIVGATSSLPADFLEAVQAELAAETVDDRRELSLPNEFLRIALRPSAKLFLRYLTDPPPAGRGFTQKQVLRMTQDFDLHYASRGVFKGRIIFPIYYQGKLVNWTGRTVYPSEGLRYRTLTVDEELSKKSGTPRAVGSIEQYLLWFDDLLEADADTIVLVEGPFDALKVNVLGRDYGICSTCFFTSSPSDAQIDLLHDLLPRFRRRLLVPDRGAEALGLRTVSRTYSLKITMKTLPKEFKDPGLLDKESLLNKVLCD